MTRYIATEKFERTPVAEDPFPHLVVRNFLSTENLARISADFPDLPGPGAFPPRALRLKGAFAGLMDELCAPWLRGAVEENSPSIWPGALLCGPCAAMSASETARSTPIRGRRS